MHNNVKGLTTKTKTQQSLITTHPILLSPLSIFKESLEGAGVDRETILVMHVNILVPIVLFFLSVILLPRHLLEVGLSLYLFSLFS